MSRKTASLFYPLLVYLSLIDPISVFSVIPVLFFLANRWIRRFAWVYFTLGTLTLVIAFFFFQMTTRNELAAILGASVVALLLREAEQVPFWAILLGWLALLGWFSGPLAVLCVLVVMLIEWEWYKKTAIVMLLLVLLFFPLPLKTSVWWLPKDKLTRVTQQHFGFHNYEGKYHQMSVEADPGSGTPSKRVAFSRPITWMDSILDWTVFFLFFLVIILLVRLLFMLRYIRQKVSPYVARSLWIVFFATLFVSSLAFVYRLAFRRLSELPPDGPIDAITRFIRQPTTVSTHEFPLLPAIQTIAKTLPPWLRIAFITVMIVIALSLLVANFILVRSIMSLFQTSLSPDKTPQETLSVKSKESVKPLRWAELQTLPVQEIINRVYARIRTTEPQTEHLTPYEYESRYPSEPLKTWTEWIIRLHYAPAGMWVLPTMDQVRDVFLRFTRF